MVFAKTKSELIKVIKNYNSYKIVTKVMTELRKPRKLEQVPHQTLKYTLKSCMLGSMHMVCTSVAILPHAAMLHPLPFYLMLQMLGRTWQPSFANGMAPTTSAHNDKHIGLPKLMLGNCRHTLHHHSHELYLTSNSHFQKTLRQSNEGPAPLYKKYNWCSTIHSGQIWNLLVLVFSSTETGVFSRWRIGFAHTDVDRPTSPGKP